MTIANPEFPLLFFPFLCFYWLLRNKPGIQNLFLLFFGYFIYSLVSINYALMLAIFTLIVWSLTSVASKQASQKLRTTICSFCIVLCIGTLFAFKYQSMFATQSQNFLQWLGINYNLPIIDIVLPLGLSFYTFQAITYIVAVMKGERDSANLLNFSNYLSFAPTILAGPICRPHQLLDPLNSKRSTSNSDVDRIIVLVCSFLVKKVWIASWISNSYVDPIFADASSRNTIELVLCLVAYSLQIFFDFSGYTDLARAVALMLGFNLPQNFKTPYLSRSLSEFWTRWHISLSSWIRDYIYFPLGGSRKGLMLTLLNLMIAMSLSGLWHGASLKFLIWGFYHGCLLCTEKLMVRFGWIFQNICITFFLVSFGWIFFRCENLIASLQYLKSLANWNYPVNLELNHFSILVVTLLAFAVWSYSDRLTIALEKFLSQTPFAIKALLAAIFMQFILSFSPDGMPSFIYAQF